MPSCRRAVVDATPWRSAQVVTVSRALDPPVAGEGLQSLALVRHTDTLRRIRAGAEEWTKGIDGGLDQTRDAG